MAAAEPLQTIKEEVTCPICLELFRDPVTSECGHSFCQECIARLCQGDGDVTCPLCNEKLQKGNLRPNRELKNIVELVKSQAVEDPRGGYVCKMHREPLRFYCKEDETPVCMACDKSQAHLGHTVVPMGEAVQEHRETIRQQLEGIESSYKTLNQLLTTGCTYLPQSAREEEHQRLKRLIDNVATLLKVHTEGPRQRFADAASQTQPRDPDWRGVSPGREAAGGTESQGPADGTMAAAAADSVQRIKAEATCSICLELLQDPQTTGCGHSFCKPCITQHCERSVGVLCHQCRKRLPKGSLRPNQELRNIVEFLRSQTAENPAGGNRYERHGAYEALLHRGSAPHLPGVQGVPGSPWSPSGSHEEGCQGVQGREPGSEPAAERQEETGSRVGRGGKRDPTRKGERSQGSLDEVRTETPEGTVARALDIESDDSEETEREGRSGEGALVRNRTPQPRRCPPKPLRPPSWASVQRGLQPLPPVPQPVPLRPPHQTERHSGEGDPAGDRKQHPQLYPPMPSWPPSRPPSPESLWMALQPLPPVSSPPVVPLQPPHQTERHSDSRSHHSPASTPTTSQGQAQSAQLDPRVLPLLPVQMPQLLPPPPPHQTERQRRSGREPGSEPAAETQQETGSHVSPVGQKDPTSKHELSQGSLDAAFHMISGTRGDAEPKEAPRRPKQRFADPASQTQYWLSPESEFPWWDVSEDTELEGRSGREPSSEPAAETREETRSHVGEETPTTTHGLSQAVLDEAFHKISSTGADAEPKVAVKETRKRPLSPAEGSGGSRTDASSASSEEEGAALGSGTKAAGEGQQHPAKKRKDNEN